VPLDKWFGSFHDGTPEAHERMKKRRLMRGGLSV
jgi:lathosterol oxidase